MKHAKIYLLTIIASLLGSSCSDFLDVRPQNEILLEDMWQRESDVEAVLLACYRAMEETALMKRVIVWGELRSDNMQSGDLAKDKEQALTKINEVSIQPNNDYSSWAPFYTVINYCNTLLEFAPGVMEKDINFTAGDLQVKSAEALAIRSLCYFYLVRTFRVYDSENTADDYYGIPWSSTATIDDTQNLKIKITQKSEVLDLLIADLLKAEEWALETYATTNATKGRMTKDAIRALLADVYLWKGDYDKCVEYCDKLINAKSDILVDGELMPRYEMIERDALTSAYNQIFYNQNSSESIFELQYSSDVNNDAIIELYGEQDKAGRLIASNFLLTGDLFSTTDVRQAKSIHIISTSSASNAENWIFKYRGSHNTYSSGASSSNYSYRTSKNINWIFYRITDIMLMKAEALVQLNRSNEDLRGALHLVNTTYMRSNPTLLEKDSLKYDTYSTQDAMEKLVLDERQRELLFEGKRWFDLVRISERKNSPAELVAYVRQKYTSNAALADKLSVMKAIYMPVNETELKRNTFLRQNDYYASSSSIEKK